MTNLEKIEAEEYKQQRIIDNNYCCEVCGKRFGQSQLQLAHRIPKHKNYIKRFGNEVINHELNLVLTCNSHNGRCNDSVMISPDTIRGQQHIDIIKEVISESRNII